MNLITLNARFNEDEVYTIIGFDDRFTIVEITDLALKIWNQAGNDNRPNSTVTKFNQLMRSIPGITVFDNTNWTTIYV
jgi:hypothetical protein